MAFFKNLKRTQNPFANIFFASELKRFLKKEKFDLIHFNSSNTLFGVLGIFCLKNKPKTVFTVHGSSFLSPGFKRSKISKLFFLLSMRLFMPLVDKIIFVSKYDRKLAEDYKLVRAGQGEVIYNGIGDINFFKKQEAINKLKEIKNFPDDKIIIGTISRLEYAKGIDILIEIINNLPKENLDKCAFLIIGDGPERKNYELLITNYKLQNNIFLLGDIPEAVKYLKTFDIFVMTSRYEGAPYALLEAMSVGLPIVATSVGGVSELLGDAGILIKPGDIENFTSNVSDLSGDFQKREKLSKMAVERINNFSFSKNLQETKNVFMSLCGLK